MYVRNFCAPERGILEMIDDKPTFLTLLDRLTKAHNVTIQRDHGTETHEQNGLLQQLREAMFTGMETMGGSAQFGSRPPIDAGATDLLTEITEQATQVLAEVSKTVTPFGHAETYVRLWAAAVREDQLFTTLTRATVDDPDQHWADTHSGSVITVKNQYTAYRLLEKWVDRIEDFFNPVWTREIPANCPDENCRARYVYRRKDGHMTASAALNIIRDRVTGISIEAKCSACGRTWPRNQFGFLAELVGATPPPELAEKESA